MTKREFYVISFIVIYTYFALLFHISIKNFISAMDATSPGEKSEITFNAFK